MSVLPGGPVAIDDRLVRCFAVVFPELSEKDICAVDIGALNEMDSLAGVNLVALIDEEYGVDLDFEDLLRLGTFEAIQRHLNKSPSELLSRERAAAR